MALLYVYGFDNYANAADLVADPNWSDPGGALFSTTAGRFGGGTTQVGPNSINRNDEWDFHVSNINTFFFGASFRIANSETGQDSEFLRFFESGTINMELRLNNSTHRVDVRAGGVLLGEFPFLLYVWHRLEVFFIVDNAVGEVTVRIDEEEVFTATGIDTQNTTNAWVDTIRFREEAFGNAGATIYYDDVTINDTTGGAPNNTWLGDLRVQTLLPDGDGSATDFTPLGAGTHFSELDETPGADDDTSYVESSIATDQDLLTMGALSGVQTTIFALNVVAHARKDDAGARSIILLARENVTTGSGASQALIDSVFTNHFEIFELNPDTSSAWSTAEINAAEIGFENV